MRLLFWGDSRWGALSLRRLLTEGHTISGVVIRKSPSDKEMEQIADELGILRLQPDKANDPSFVEKVESLKPELNVSVSYDQILKRPILESAPKGFINAHAGMLPYYRGRNVINWAIINGEEEIGITIHQVDEGIDTGPIWVQRSVPIHWKDTYASVLERVTLAIPEAIGAAVALVSAGNTKPRCQPVIGTYLPARQKGDEWIDWNDSSKNIYNFIRAITDPGPGARTLLSRKEVVIWSAEYESDWPHYRSTPGEVIGKDDRGILVKTGDSFIRIMCVQEKKNSERFVPVYRIGTRFDRTVNATLREFMQKVSTLKQERTGLIRRVTELEQVYQRLEKCTEKV